MQHYFSVLFLFIVNITVGNAQHFELEKVSIADGNLDNVYRIDEGVYRSEQPNSKDFKLLEKYGIKEVLNLRRWHSDNDEAEETSLTLHRIKTNAHSLSMDEIIEALRVIKNRQGPILIHCKHGSDRTGAVIAMYRIIFQNVSKEKAIEEMCNGGFGFHRIYRNIVRRISKADIDLIRRKLEIDTAL